MPSMTVRSFAVLMLAACSATERGTMPGFTRTDSAGFMIATNTAPVTALEPVLAADSTPRLRIGVEAGEEPLQFNGIRGVVTLDDGRIAVANGRPVEIRVFSPTGVFLTKLGASGRGPGEFQALSSLIPGGGDTVLAVNMPYFQLLRFSMSGGYLGMSAPPRDTIAARMGRMRRVEGVSQFFRNGSMVVAARPDTAGPTDGSQYPTGELFRSQSTPIWIGADGAQTAVLGTFGEIQQMFIDIGAGRRDATIPPSARLPRRAMGGRGTRLCIAGNDGPEIRCLDQDGKRLIIRWTQDSVPTSPEMVERWRESVRADAARSRLPDAAQIAERIISGIIIPSTVPPVSALIVDADGRVLVGGPDLAAPDGWRRMRVFSADGELIGVADLPAIAAHELGRDSLLGVWRNEDGVEFVVVHNVRSR